ncbi:MAG: Alpha-glucosides-binding periplasmic protein AglE precursor [uncultured Nocardioidaceae bacterium]|uniref:Alpha-glucosides-binding periplasmic protein AglE n=1 Tax=uncultured Nocardioidaceae bacterium TaxID=253824 RepID=A0A6J4MJB6_9ACTN|nr:MAG: Alpha-glucosides-binding periplasmic protein AglE precursor [uncultured Nocardioidaceae bacterium]
MQQKSPRRKAVVGVAVASAMSLTLAACGGGGSGGDDSTVEIWSSTDPLVFEGLKKSIEAEAEKEGITVDVQRVTDINTVIMTKIQAGDVPDIAMIPQPGVVADIVDRGAAEPLDDVVDQADLEDMVPGTLEAGTFEDQLYGLLVSMNLKSLVYYPKKAFEQAGYKAPTTLAELEQLTEQIKSDGTPPWCFTIASEGSTGWPATDWMEDLVARYGGPDVYQQWVSHEIPFNDDVVVQAGEEFEKLVLAEGNAAGGRSSMSSTDFGKADDPMWDAKPGCMLLKQGNFIISPDFLPADVVENVDENIGVFGFPAEEAGGESPVVGGGDLAVLMDDNEDAKKIMAIMAKADIGLEAAPESSFLSPHTSFDVSLYPSELTRQTADVAYSASAFLFDGSDVMPGAVGAGSFWKEMTAFISGSQDLQTSLDNIESSWPSS